MTSNHERGHSEPREDVQEPTEADSGGTGRAPGAADEGTTETASVQRPARTQS